MEREDLKNEIEMDYINALATYKAKEAGAFGRIQMETEEIGIFGAAMSDVQKTIARFLLKEISKEEAKEELKQTAFTAVKTLITTVAHKAIDSVATFLKIKLPALSSVIEAGKEFVKREIVEKVVDKVVETGKKAVNWIKEKLKI